MRNFLIFVLSAGVLFSCVKKNPVKPPPDFPVDYREKYTGIYNVRKTCTLWTLSFELTDTICDFDTIINIRKSSDFNNKVIIGNWVIPVDSITGTYDAQPGEVYPYLMFSIGFYEDSVSISTTEGGMSGLTICSLTGRKI